jgi:polyisoprenyl-phosphate glycosyltransferase
MTSRGQFRLVVLMPVFCDWAIASDVCARMDRELARLADISVRVLLVDDGSPEPLVGWNLGGAQNLDRVDVLHLRRNMGHQRAIAMGLCFVHDEIECDAVLVMDADGEDRPEHVSRLIRRFREEPDAVVFAERHRRFESRVFRAGYWSYRLLHRALTGIAVREGNFSILPFAALSRLVNMSELWNHYAGAVYKSKLRYVRIPADRGQRLGGQSHMNLVELVVHGLSGISTFYDVVATRILIASLASVVVLVAAIAVVVGIRLSTNLAVPGWATFTAGLLFVLMLQVVSISFSLVFSLITTRLNMTFVPRRDYRIFVEGTRTLWGRKFSTANVQSARA